MATHNGERFIREAIESILCQTFTDFEFIIVDDGSQDCTSKILEEYAAKDKRIKVLSQSHQGLTNSLINGIRNSSGEFIARQDDDDLSDSRRLEKQLGFLRSPGFALTARGFILCASSWWNIDEDGKILSQGQAFPFFPEPFLFINTLPLKNIFCHGSLMFRRDAYDEAGGYSPSFAYAQDYDLLLRMMDYGEYHAIYEPLYSLRVHRFSISLTKSQEQAACAEAARTLHRARISKGKPATADRYEWIRFRRGGRTRNFIRLIRGFSSAIANRFLRESF